MRGARGIAAALVFASFAGVALVMAGCAENNAQTKAMCPGTTAPRCIAGLVCDEDKARGCQVCRCQAPYDVPVNQPPQGPPQPLPQ